MLLLVPIHMILTGLVIRFTNKISIGIIRWLIRLLMVLSGPALLCLYLNNEEGMSMDFAVFMGAFLYVLTAIFSLIAYGIISAIIEKSDEKRKMTPQQIQVRREIKHQKRNNFFGWLIIIILVILYVYGSLWAVNHEAHWR